MGASMKYRATSRGIHLTADDAALVKGMLDRGDRQHDIAAWFGVNGGRIAEIATGTKFVGVKAASDYRLPPPGPYPAGRDAVAALNALTSARLALDAAERAVKIAHTS